MRVTALKCRTPAEYLSGSQAPALIVIHKHSQTGKSVISADMPKSKPWTVTNRLCKCFIYSTCQALVSRPWILRASVVSHSLPSLDAGFRHPCRNDGPLFVYNGESSSLVTLPYKLQLSVTQGSWSFNVPRLEPRNEQKLRNTCSIAPRIAGCCECRPHPHRSPSDTDWNQCAVRH